MDGGSLDLILKKAGRIPEAMLGTVTCAVSCYISFSYVLFKIFLRKPSIRFAGVIVVGDGTHIVFCFMT